MAELLRIFDF